VRLATERVLCETCDTHSSVAEDSSLLGCYVVLTVSTHVSNWCCRQETGDNYRLALLINYNSVDQIKENVIGTACSTYCGEEKSRALLGKPAGKRPRSRRIYDDNIKADLQEI